MRLRKLPYWLWQTYSRASFALALLNYMLGFFIITIGTIHVGKLVISMNHMFLIILIFQITVLIHFTQYTFKRSYNSIEERWIINILAIMFYIAIPVSFVLTIWVVLHNPQDLATLAIIWVFVIPIIISVAKTFFMGLSPAVGGAVGKRLYDEVTRPDDKPAK